MKDYVTVSCPKCARSLSARRQYIGRDVTCRHCGQIFNVQPAVDSVAPAGESAQPPDRSGDEGPADPSAKMAAWKATCEQLERVRAELLGDRDGLRGDLEQTRLSLSAARAEAESLRDRREQVNLEHEQVTDELRTELDELRAVSERDRAALAEKVARLADENDAARRHAEAERSRLNAEAEAARTGWEVERQQVEADWETRWQSALDEAQRHRADAEDLRARLDQGRDRLAAEPLKEQGERSRARGEHEVTETELERLRCELERARQDHDRLAAALESFQNAHEKVLENHLAEIQSVGIERDRMVAQVGKSEQAIQGLNRDLEEAHAKLARVQATVEAEREARESQIAPYRTEERERAATPARVPPKEPNRMEAVSNVRLRDATGHIDGPPMNGVGNGGAIPAPETDRDEKTAAVADPRRSLPDASTSKRETATVVSASVSARGVERVGLEVSTAEPGPAGPGRGDRESRTKGKRLRKRAKETEPGRKRITSVFFYLFFFLVLSLILFPYLFP